LSAQSCTRTLPAALEALAGSMVTRFVIDDALSLALHSAGREVALRIDGNGRLEHAGTVHAFSPDADPRALGPVLALLHERVASVVLGTDGELALEFTGGARLCALPDEHNVAWTVQVTGGGSVSCLAEGKVVWR
jgi:hypothetical protein